MFSASPSGQFIVRNLGIGTYVLRAEATTATGHVVGGSSVVRMGGEDVVGLQVPLRPGAIIRGRVAAVEGPLPDLSASRVTLSPLSGVILRTQVPALPIAKDGTFTVPTSTPATYRLALSGLPPSWGVARVSSPDAEMKDDQLSIVEGAEVITLHIEMSDLAGRIDGVVLDTDNRPSPRGYVIVFADDEREWHAGSPRVRISAPDSSGSYSFSGILTGRYFVTAIETFASDEWIAPSLLRALAATLEAITIGGTMPTRYDIRKK